MRSDVLTSKHEFYRTVEVLALVAASAESQPGRSPRNLGSLAAKDDATLREAARGITGLGVVLAAR